MAKHIKKCLVDQKYTMENECPSCGSETIIPRPPKFSVKDKYASYRRDIKKGELKEKGLY